MSDAAVLFLYAETPVHAGSDTGSGALDLPIQREVATGLPIIKGESLKGALRERFRPVDTNDKAALATWRQVFGQELTAGGGETRPGSLRVHEAQLVAFPAPTMEGTFMWVTSPLACARLARKAKLAGLKLPELPAGQTCVGGTKRGELVVGPYVVDFRPADPELGARQIAQVHAWAQKVAEVALPDTGDDYFRVKLTDDLLRCSDELLAAISRECAPVHARVQLGKEINGEPAKMVQNGPFYSEYLPGETLLAALVEGKGEDLKLIGQLHDKVLRVGGDESIGKGLMWCRLWRADAAQG
ncbi:type III-B CRISPR module RAMP protein Cmr4 [Microbispora bryophytorum]|uniref:type III-B CRISPR module RAMP protein Cmr4 n=1 Tax=Microbispora bryophytorum TaxID=1460882 RepID=UPI003400AEC7